jgi:phosphatidylserine/phosphatidylglycerophosphate/cardiolipin synthase-like enzyme
MTKVIIQPADGIEPLLDAIGNAKQSIEIIIYRLDRLEIEQALIEAVRRGLKVHALVTFINRGDEAKDLRKTVARLKEGGVTISETPADYWRYHYKMLIIDRRLLFLTTFNFTFLDIHHSRAFGVMADDKSLLADAVELFEADSQNRVYAPNEEHLIVSPLNSRARLLAFIHGAEEQLLIYDEKLSDAQLIRLLRRHAAAGVDIKIIGHVDVRAKELKVRKLPQLEHHAQVIIRDRKTAFLGSQSLRRPELDSRREAGLIVSDAQAVKDLTTIFELDWGDLVS